MITTISRHL